MTKTAELVSLIQAINENNHKVAEEILENNPLLRTTSSQFRGETDEDVKEDALPIYFLCRNPSSDFEMAKIILGNGNYRDSEDNTPLITATRLNRYDLAIFFLEKEQDVNSVNRFGNSALHYAYHFGNDLLVNALLANHADSNLKNASGLSPKEVAENRLMKLEDSLSNDVEEIIKSQLRSELEQITKENSQDKVEDETQRKLSRKDLNYLARKFEMKGVSFPKDRDINLNAKEESEGNALIHYIVANGNLGKQFIILLHNILNGEANVNIQNRQGYAPIVTACYNNCLESAKVLLERGADLTIRDVYGNIPLHHTCDRGHLEVVKFLLENDSEKTMLNAVNDEGNSPLHIACREQKEDVIMFLLEKGADYKIKNEDNKMPVAMIEGNNVLKTKVILKQIEISQPKPLTVFAPETSEALNPVQEKQL